MKKAFTLIELLIVLVLVGGLTAILFRSYTHISQLAVRIENEKVLASEIMLSQQFIQNLTDTNHIDFEAYTGENALPLDQLGYTTTLALTGTQAVLIYQTGECMPFTGDFNLFGSGMQSKKCWLEAQIGEQITQLTDPTTVYISNITFKVLPTAYYTGDVVQYFDDRAMRQSEGARMLGHLRIRNYASQRTRNVHIPIQNFYHLSP